MADILIRGMEMPKNCGSCRFMYQEVGEMNDDIVMVLMCSACFQGTAESEYKNERAAFCPLIELPEHEDLIDRDSIPYTDTYTGMIAEMDQIDRLPVIVPSNKEETK